MQALARCDMMISLATQMDQAFIMMDHKQKAIDPVHFIIAKASCPGEAETMAWIRMMWMLITLGTGRTQLPCYMHGTSMRIVGQKTGGIFGITTSHGVLAEHHVMRIHHSCK